MTQSGNYHGAVTFFGDPEPALDRFTRISTATLEDYGHPVERQSILDKSRSRIIANHYMVKLSLAPAPNAVFELKTNNKSLQRLVIEICPVVPGLDEKDISELMLVVMMFRMVDVFPIKAVEWLTPDAVLTLEQFLSAFSSVSPRRVQGRQEVMLEDDDLFDSSETVDPKRTRRLREKASAENLFARSDDYCLIDFSEQETLTMAYRYSPRPQPDNAPEIQQEATNDIQRLASWGMTGMIGFLSAPVAVSMVAVNLIKGEDFRLNTNVLSLTGLLVMLQSTGALASAVSYLPL